MAGSCLGEANRPKGAQTVCSDRSVAISLQLWASSGGAGSGEESGVSAAVNAKYWKFLFHSAWPLFVLPAGVYKGCGGGSSYPSGEKDFVTDVEFGNTAVIKTRSTFSQLLYCF